MIGETFGRHRILGKLGHGGMGEVYLATDTRLGRQIALKILPARFATDADRLRWFEQEARAASALNHPNIITIYDVGVEDGTPYIAMEIVEGRTLREILRGGPLPPEVLLDVAAQTAAGLAKAHETGIVHRDLKPENLMVSNDGYVKILDFGLAKLAPAAAAGTADVETRTITQAGVLMGTVSYMSPEQMSGRPVDFRSDQFSFGTILYEMAAGRNPFQRDTAAGTIAAVMEREPEPLPARAPAGLPAVTARCLAKMPEQRYASTRELAGALDALRTAPPAASTKTRRAVIGAAAAAILGAAAGIFWLANHTADGREMRPLVAMRPFKNLSDPSQEYFTAGVTQEVRNQISRLSGVGLLSAGAVSRYKDGENRKLAADTGASSIVEGSVRVDQGRLKVDVEVVDCKTDRALWSEHFDRGVEEAAVLQGDIALRVAGALKLKVTPAEQQRLAKWPTANAAAYDLYLKAQKLRQNGEENGRAMEMLRQAIAMDSRFVEAMAALSLRNNWRVVYADNSETEAALRLAQKALAIDAASDQAYHAMAGAYGLLGRVASSRAALVRCLELNPNQTSCMNDLCDLEMDLGHLDEALRWSRRALLLSPNVGGAYYHVGMAVFLLHDPEAIAKWMAVHRKRYPNSYVLMVDMNVLLDKGYRDAALALARREAAARPQAVPYQAMLAEVAFLAGAPDAEALTEPYFRSGPDPRFAQWGALPHSARARYAYLLLKRGERERGLSLLADAKKVIEDRLAQGIDSPLASEELAAIEAMRGDRQAALAAYRRAYDAGWRHILLTSINPMLDPLRSDPEFQKLLETMKADVARMRAGSRELVELTTRTIPMLDLLPLPGDARAQ